VNLTQEQTGYVAGMIDGEGCIYFNPSSRKTRFRCVPVLNITNTNSEVILYLQSLIGGTIHIQQTESGWKPRYFLNLHSKKARWVLEAVQHLLVVKRCQVKLILRWYDITGKFKLIDKEGELQKIFWKTNKQLNSKGIKKEDEFKENLSNETILSLALREIEEKVQRLEAEAKDVKIETIASFIKERGAVSNKELRLRFNTYQKFDLVSDVRKLLQPFGITTILKGKKGQTIYYVYAGNASTSVLPDNGLCQDEIVRTA